MKEKVSDLMRPWDSGLRPGSSLAQAAIAMVSARAREALVTAEDGDLVGIVHADDLFNAPGNTVESVVRPARLVIPVDASVSDAARIMNKVRCEHAVVVDRHKVVGIFSLQNAVERMAD